MGESRDLASSNLTAENQKKQQVNDNNLGHCIDGGFGLISDRLMGNQLQICKFEFFFWNLKGALMVMAFYW